MSQRHLISLALQKLRSIIYYTEILKEDFEIILPSQEYITQHKPLVCFFQYNTSERHQEKVCAQERVREFT